MSHDQSFLAADAASYLARTIPVPYPEMERVEADVRAGGQPAIGRVTGSVLRALALGAGARRALEVGTNIGMSGMWIASGLAAGGRFEGIEIDAGLARRAEVNLRAAVHVTSTVHVGAALDVLPKLPDRAFDLVFLDAVKSEYPRYLDHALRLARPGGIIAADNMFWSGRAWDPSATDADTVGVREYTRRALSEPRLTTTIVPVEDGLAVSVVR